MAGSGCSEALLHGTLPWIHPTRERRSLLYRYIGRETNFNAGVYTAEQQPWVGELSDAQRAVLEPAYGRSRPELQRDGETLVEVDGGAGGLGKMFWDRKKARDKGEEEGAVPALFANGVMVGGSEAERAEQKKANGGW